MYLGMKMNKYLIYLPENKFKDLMELLLLENKDNSHYF